MQLLMQERQHLFEAGERSLSLELKAKNPPAVVRTLPIERAVSQPLEDFANTRPKHLRCLLRAQAGIEQIIIFGRSARKRIVVCEAGGIKDEPAARKRICNPLRVEGLLVLVERTDDHRYGRANLTRPYGADEY